MIISRKERSKDKKIIGPKNWKEEKTKARKIEGN